MLHDICEGTCGIFHTHFLELFSLKMAEEYKASRVLKYTLLAFNFVYWGIGCLLISVGVVAVAQKIDNKYFMVFTIPPDPTLFRIQGAVMVLIGVFIFVIGVIGTLGIIREDICILKAYLYAIIIIVVLEIIAVIAVCNYWRKAKKTVEGSLKRSIDDYRLNPDQAFATDRIQEEFKCCGISDLNDWNANRYYECGGPSYEQCGVPHSCCVREPEERPNLQCGWGVRKENILNLKGKIYITGCLDPVWKSFRKLLVNVVAAISFSFVFPEVAGVVTTFVFIKKIQKQNESTGIASQEPDERGGQIADSTYL